MRGGRGDKPSSRSLVMVGNDGSCPSRCNGKTASIRCHSSCRCHHRRSLRLKKQPISVRKGPTAYPNRKGLVSPIIACGTQVAASPHAAGLHEEEPPVTHAFPHGRGFNFETGASSSATDVTGTTHNNCKRTMNHLLLEAFRDEERRLSKEDFLTLFAYVCSECSWELALKVFRSMQRQRWFSPNPRWYAKIIAAVGRGKQADAALELFEELQSLGQPVTVYMCNALLIAYGNSKQTDTALVLLRHMRTLCGCIPNTSSYNTVMSFLGKEGKLDDVKALFREMQSNGCQPDTYTYNSLIAGYGRSGQYDEMMSVAKMMRSVGKTLDITSYNSLFTWLGKAGLLKDLEVVYREMKKDGCSLNTRTSNTLLNAFAIAGLVDNMEEVFSEMQLSCRPDRFSFLCLIKGYATTKKLSKMQAALDAMYREGFQLDLASYCRILDACLDTGRKGILRTLRRRLGMPVDEEGLPIAYDQYLKTWVVAYAKAGDIRELQSGLRELQTSGLELDQVAYGAIIDAYGGASLFAEMEQTLEKLLEVCENGGDRCSESSVLVRAMNAVIGAYGRVGKVKDMERCWERLKETGVRPNAETFVAMLKGYLKAKTHAKMEDVLEVMRQSNIAPSERIYNLLLVAYGKTGNVAQMEAVVREMRAAGVAMTEPATFGCLLGSYVAAGRYEEVPTVLKTMDACRCAPDARMLAMLISFSAACKRSGDAQTIIACFEWLASGRFHVFYKLLLLPSLEVGGRLPRKPRSELVQESNGYDEDRHQRLQDIKCMYHCLQDAFGNDKQSVMGVCHAVIEFAWIRGLHLLAADVVFIGVERGVFSEDMYCTGSGAWLLDLRRASLASAEALLMAWFADIKQKTGRNVVPIPAVAQVIVGWGKLSRNNGHSPLKQSVKRVLDKLGSPFKCPEFSGGCFEAQGTLVHDWLADVSLSPMMEMIWNEKESFCESVLMNE